MAVVRLGAESLLAGVNTAAFQALVDSRPSQVRLTDGESTRAVHLSRVTDANKC